MSSEASDETSFNKAFNEAYAERATDYNAHVNIALVGKVSSGKSSLLNAILERTREDPIAAVGAESGVTTEIKPYQLDEKVLIIDCPGLDDIKEENSELTKAFLGSIDLGIFVVTGSAEGAQRANFDDLKAKSRNVIVVLNKIDEWDDLEEEALDRVMEQWRDALGTACILPTNSKGFDPKSRPSLPMDIRGVDAVRAEIVAFLKREKKDILFLKNLKDKSSHATSIIVAALMAVAGEAFLPGSAAYITATQIVAITALNYLYTGEVLSKTSALALLPAFVGESLGSNLFLWAKSFLPPTGIVDAAAALIAVSVTFAMLGAVKWMLESGRSLTDTKRLKLAFNVFNTVASELKTMSLADLKDPKALTAFILRLLQGVVVPERSST